MKHTFFRFQEANAIERRQEGPRGGFEPIRNFLIVHKKYLVDEKYPSNSVRTVLQRERMKRGDFYPKPRLI